MNRTLSLLTTALGALTLVVAGGSDLLAQRGGSHGAGQGKPPSAGPVNPGQGGKPGGPAGGGNPNGGGGGNHGNPNNGSGNPNAGGGSNSGNPNRGGGNPNAGGGGGKQDQAGKPDGQGHGRGNAGANRPDDDRGGRGGHGNAANLPKDAEGFKNYGQMVAARHVSQNLGIDFDKLKSLMTGDNPKSLGQAIQELRPEADANAEAAKAEKQAEKER